MTQEEKQILIKDLCCRLPHKVIVEFVSYKGEEKPWIGELSCKDLDCFIHDVGFVEIKPYLFPLSSMTEEEISDLQKINSQFCFDTFDNFAYVGAADDGFCSVEEMSNILNYLNSHHFDYLGLIEKGLAIKVTEENNPYNITEE